MSRVDIEEKVGVNNLLGKTIQGSISYGF